MACKQWNQLPDDGLLFTGMSYDNTVTLGASTWRHVAFVERPVALSTQDAGAFSWLFSSDVCKHCARAGCLESCPTGAIIRTEFDSVYVQPDICNGCGYCVINCPFGVIGRQEEDGRAWKCTLCYDRLKEDMMPACAKACPPPRQNRSRPARNTQYWRFGRLSSAARSSSCSGEIGSNCSGAAGSSCTFIQTSAPLPATPLA